MYMRFAASAVILFLLWLLMSGVYKPLTIGLGAGSSLVTAYLVHRMVLSTERGAFQLIVGPVRFLRYMAWLLVEIAKANWSVAKAIMSPNMPIRQHFFCVPSSQKSDLARAIFANSITLTPGTITVEVEDAEFWVHAVSFKDEDPQALAQMDANVTAVEV